MSATYRIDGDPDAPDLAWHLTADTLRDGRPVPATGEWLTHEGPVKICRTGLHASRRLLDALTYAPGGVTTIHRVEVEDVCAEQGDKVVCRRRRIVASYPLGLRRVVRLACESASLAAWCAGLYLPELITAAEAADRGDWAAAGAAARDAAWAAWAAAGAAAGGAAWDAARDAAGAAAGAAVGGAAWAAARGAARAAAWAAGDATWDAAGDALETRAIALLTGGAS